MRPHEARIQSAEAEKDTPAQRQSRQQCGSRAACCKRRRTTAPMRIHGQPCRRACKARQCWYLSPATKAPSRSTSCLFFAFIPRARAFDKADADFSALIVHRGALHAPVSLSVGNRGNANTAAPLINSTRSAGQPPPPSSVARAGQRPTCSSLAYFSFPQPGWHGPSLLANLLARSITLPSSSRAAAPASLAACAASDHRQ